MKDSLVCTPSFEMKILGKGKRLNTEDTDINQMKEKWKKLAEVNTQYERIFGKELAEVVGHNRINLFDEMKR